MNAEVSCREAERLIFDLALDETPPERLAAHLAGCPSCRAEYEANRMVERRLQQAAWPSPRLAPEGHRATAWPRPLPERAAPIRGAKPDAPISTLATLAALGRRIAARFGPATAGWPWALVTTMIAVASVWLGHALRVDDLPYLGIGGELAFATGGRAGPVQVCVRNRDGRVRIIDDGKVCEDDETALATGAVSGAGPLGAAGVDYRAGKTTIKAGTSVASVYFSTPMATSDYRVAIVPTNGALFAPDKECRYLNVSAKTTAHFGIDVRKCHATSRSDQIDRVAEDLILDWVAVPSR